MAFYYPAYSAWLPALVPESDLQAVNGFEGMVRPTIGQAVGPAVAGAVVAAFTPGVPAFATPPASSVVTVLALLKVPQTPVRRILDPEHAMHPVRTALRDMREGLVYMVHTPWLLATLLFASLMILVMMGPLEVLIPFLVKDELGGGPSDHSFVLAGFGIGGALGSLAMASVRMPRRYLTLMNLGWAVACLPFVVIGLTSQVWVVVACAFCHGCVVLLRRWSSGAPADSAGSRRRCSGGWRHWTSSCRSRSCRSPWRSPAPSQRRVGLKTTFAVAGYRPRWSSPSSPSSGPACPKDELAHPLDDPQDAG